MRGTGGGGGGEGEEVGGGGGGEGGDVLGSDDKRLLKARAAKSAGASCLQRAARLPNSSTTSTSVGSQSIKQTSSPTREQNKK